MRNSTDKRKTSPLQIWRTQYNFIAVEIRKARWSRQIKAANLRFEVKAHPWPLDWTPEQIARVQRRRYKAAKMPQDQSALAHLRAIARGLMQARPEYQRAAQAMWEANKLPPSV